MADTGWSSLLQRCAAVYPPSADAPHEGTGWSWPVRCVRVEHEDDLHLNSGMKWRDGPDTDRPCGCCPTCGALPGHQNPPTGQPWQHSHRPVVTPSRTDRQPPTSPTRGKGGKGATHDATPTEAEA